MASDYFGSKPPPSTCSLLAQLTPLAHVALEAPCKNCDVCQETSADPSLASHNCLKQAKDFLEVIQEVLDDDHPDITGRLAILVAVGSKTKAVSLLNNALVATELIGLGVKVLARGWDKLPSYGLLWYFRLKNLDRLLNYLLTRDALREVQRHSSVRLLENYSTYDG